MKEKIKYKGRPRKEKVRDNVISVRLNSDELASIKDKSNLLNQTIGSYMRISALSSSVLFTISDEDRANIRVLTGMANNLNQLAKNSHTQNLLALMDEVIILRNSIAEIANKIQP